jgi:4-amino-4-deoxy-L-arabinose transferase-like glycosyltransferase
VLETTAALQRDPLERKARPPQAPGTPPAVRADTRFWIGVASAVVLGAVVRIAYLFHGAPVLVLGDGFGYHFEASRIADGLGYTSAIGDVGAEMAHHPPGWVTLLAGVAEFGWRDMRAHQVTGVVIGLGLIVVTALVGRRYAGRRVGVVAAFLAAAYPGFWVLEAQILSEPLGLVVAGLLMLVLADLWERPTLARALLAGAVSGALALVRSEQLALLAIAVAPILLLNTRISFYRRLAWTGAATLTALVLIAPWTIYNLGRFEEPVLVSTNVGGTLLAGNCPPTTYAGELMGHYDSRCNTQLARSMPGLDRSQREPEHRRVAFENVRDNVDRLAATVLARYGRTLGVFRPAQTVGFAASWLGSATWPVWAWVASFWLIAPLAVYGSVLLRRARAFQWPLVAPLVITLLVVTVAYGEPRYHTPADLGIVVLAAVGLDHLTRRRRRRAS